MIVILASIINKSFEPQFLKILWICEYLNVQQASSINLCAIMTHYENLINFALIRVHWLQQVNKMMKYITERFVDLNQSPAKHRNLSYIQLKRLSEIGQNQNPQTLKQALATFVNNQKQREHLIKRLNVLKEQDRQLEGRTALRDSKLEHYKSIREEITLNRKQSQLYRLKLAKEMQMTRSILSNNREAQSFALQQARRKMHFDRWNNYLDQRQSYRTEIGTTKLTMQTQIAKKRQKNIEMRLAEQQQRKNISVFHEKRRSTIKIDKQEDIIRLNKMSESRIDELQSLSNMQSILLSRQARSRMNSEETTSILNNIITYKKGPSLSKRSNSCLANNDIYVI